MFRLLRLWRSPAREDADTFRQLARQGPDDLEWSIRRQSGVGRPPCWSRLRIGRSSEAINILGGAIRADHAAARAWVRVDLIDASIRRMFCSKPWTRRRDCWATLKRMDPRCS